MENLNLETKFINRTFINNRGWTTSACTVGSGTGKLSGGGHHSAAMCGDVDQQQRVIDLGFDFGSLCFETFQVVKT